MREPPVVLVKTWYELLLKAEDENSKMDPRGHLNENLRF